MSNADYEARLNELANGIELRVAGELAGDKPLTIAIAKLIEVASRARIRASELAAKREPKEP